MTVKEEEEWHKKFIFHNGIKAFEADLDLTPCKGWPSINQTNHEVWI